MRWRLRIVWRMLINRWPIYPIRQWFGKHTVKSWPKSKLVITDKPHKDGGRVYRYSAYRRQRPWTFYRAAFVSPWYQDYDSLLLQLQKQYWDILRKVAPDQFTRQYRRQSENKWKKLRGLRR